MIIVKQPQEKETFVYSMFIYTGHMAIHYGVFKYYKKNIGCNRKILKNLSSRIKNLGIKQLYDMKI